MRREFWGLAALAAGLLLAAAPMAAHHAGATYDREHLITVSGTVTGFTFTNPHAQILFDVKDASGKVVRWVAVGDPPQRLFKLGWTKSSVKPGDQITVTGGPRKDGSPEIDMRSNQLVVNGKKLGQEGGRVPEQY